MLEEVVIENNVVKLIVKSGNRFQANVEENIGNETTGNISLKKQQETTENLKEELEQVKNSMLSNNM